jgi:uncharacterized protein YbjT (DUF2867 family)
VVGAYGLIGSYVTARLVRDGHEVVGLGRNIREALRRAPHVSWIEADLALEQDSWAERLAGVGAVVNCAGALQNSRRDDLEGVHVDGPLALARACVGQGVRRFVQISAAGVEDGPGAFSRTKRDADTALRTLDLDWVILRPGLVLAPAAFGGSALLRGLAAFPGVIPSVYAEAVVQVVSVEDVAEAVSRAVTPESPARFTAELVAAEQTTLGDILRTLRQWLGYRPAPLLRLPVLVARTSAAVADGLDVLGWRSPLRSTAIAQLRDGVRGQAADGLMHLRFAPRNLDEMLAGWPSGVQERWFARLYFVKPLILATLAAFWILSGAIGFARAGEASQVLVQGGVDAGRALIMVWSGAAMDILLGLLVCARRTAAPALLGMLLVTMAYLAGATIWRPDLWADPWVR